MASVYVTLWEICSRAAGLVSTRGMQACVCPKDSDGAAGCQSAAHHLHPLLVPAPRDESYPPLSPYPDPLPLPLPAPAPLPPPRPSSMLRLLFPCPISDSVNISGSSSTSPSPVPRAGALYRGANSPAELRGDDCGGLDPLPWASAWFR